MFLALFSSLITALSFRAVFKGSDFISDRLGVSVLLRVSATLKSSSSGNSSSVLLSSLLPFVTFRSSKISSFEKSEKVFPFLSNSEEIFSNFPSKKLPFSLSSSFSIKEDTIFSNRSDPSFDSVSALFLSINLISLPSGEDCNIIPFIKTPIFWIYMINL